MFCLRFRRWWIGARFVFDPSLSIVFILALLVAGCGGRADHAPTADSRVTAPLQPHFRSALAAPAAEIEGDGLPAQRAPLLERTRVPVDPSEPFSPNYGGPPQSEKSADAAWTPTVTRDRQSSAASGNGYSLVNSAVFSKQIAPSDSDAVRSRISVRDLPDDLPPDFRERLIVMNGLR